MKIGACYIRVSTADQTEYSPDSQLRMIRDYASKNEIALSEEYVYRDDGISGRTAEKRPAFQKMISMAKQKPKPFDVILIYSTSRFARNHEQSIVYRSMLERECGIEVMSITQPNVDKKTDMLTNAIYSIIDEWYSLDLADNVRRGMTEKALKGGYQALPPYGYEQKHKGEIMTINEDEATIVKYIFEEFLKNKSKWAIARDLHDRGIKTKKGYSITTRNITYILRNPVYKGYSRWTPTHRVFWDFKNSNTITAKGHHEAIIEESVFDEVQKRLDTLEEVTKSNSRPQETMRHWLSGLIKCSNCGTTLNYNGLTPKRKNPSFRCGGYGRGACKVMNFILASEAERLVLEYLYKITRDINVLYDANISKTENYLEQCEFIKSEIKRISSKVDRAKQAFLNAVFELEEFRKIKQSYENEISILESKLATINNNEIDYGPFQKEIANVYTILSNPNFEKNDKQTAIRSLVEKIVYDKKSNEFRIYFFR